MADRRLKLVFLLLLSSTLVMATATGASAGCHRFDLELSETSADEGDTITVTVSRDGAVGDSGVRVTASDGTARSGTDFTPLNQQVNFTGDTTERVFQINLASDGAAEPAETFTVSLSQPSGCSVNQNYDLADPQTVRISASQGSAAPPPPPRPAPAPPPAPRPAPPPAPAPVSPVRPTATASPTEEPTPEPTETSSPTPSPTPTDDGRADDGGIRPQVIIGLLALLGAIGVGAYLFNEHRKQPPTI